MDFNKELTASQRPVPDVGIQSAVLGAVASARKSGTGGRAALTGIWLAAMSVLIGAGEPEDVMALLLDRAIGIRGQGRNADAPILSEDEDGRARRTGEAATAARAVADALSGIPASDDDDFPERLLDVAVSLLCEAWGPAHVRRALWDQRTALEEGGTSVILPSEPAVPNGPSRPAAAPVPARPTAPPAPAEVPRPAPAPGPARRIELHVDVATLDGGGILHAVAMRLVHGDTCETREVTGLRRHQGLASAACQAVIEILASLPASELDTIRVSTPVEGALRLAANEGARLHAALGPTVGIEWSHRTGLGTDLARRCDRILHDRIDEEARADSSAA